MSKDISVTTVCITRCEGIRIVTQCLGFCHVLQKDDSRPFQTIVTGGEYEGLTERYGSWQDALTGHRDMVAKIFTTDIS
jgi:hypothetical protein